MQKIILVVMLAFFPLLLEAKPLRIVTSFSILADITQNLAPQDAVVSSLVGANSDAHSFQPTPEHAKICAEADMIVMNGLGFEGWLPRIIESSASKAVVVTASEGIKVRHLEEGEDAHGHNHGHDEHHDKAPRDPHAWQDVENVIVYAGNIARAMKNKWPEQAQEIEKREKEYVEKLTALHKSMKLSFKDIPKEKRKILTSHDAFGYFGAAYGVDFLAAQGFGTENDPKAQEMAKLVAQIKKENVKVYFIENMTNTKLIEQIGKDTGATKGGMLYADALSEKNGPAATYIDMMQHNFELISAAMKRN